MSTSGALLVIACSETDSRIDPAHHFNLTSPTTQVIKVAGGRTEAAINNIYYADQSNRIGMIVVIQHTGCAWSPGEVEKNVRSDIQALKSSPYIRKDVPIFGYVLDVGTGTLREVNIPSTSPEAEARQHALSQMEGFGPFWS
ncbi:carbonic anhydrase [Stemphylium lycopersici]|nr:carbonic anhydrase [Stemphylium lycopersici]